MRRTQTQADIRSARTTNGGTQAHSRRVMSFSPVFRCISMAQEQLATHGSRAAHRTRPVGWLRAILADRRAASAVEFALILPVMVVLLFGSIEIALLSHADRRVTQVTSAVADLVTRSANVTKGDVDGIFDISAALLRPFKTDSLEMRVTAAIVEPNGSYRVRWSLGRDFTPRKKDSEITDIKFADLAPNETVVVAEAAYTYKPVAGVLPEFTLKKVTFYQPRVDDEVELLGG